MNAIDISWHDSEAKNILVIEFHEGWTWTDYATDHEREFEIIREMNHPVVMIEVASTPRASRPPNGNGFAVLRSLAQRIPKQVIGVYVVISNPFVAEIVKIFGRMKIRRGLEIRAVPSFEAAVKQAYLHLTEKTD